MSTVAAKSLRRYGYAHGLLVNGLTRTGSCMRRKIAVGWSRREAAAEEVESGLVDRLFKILAGAGVENF